MEVPSPIVFEESQETPNEDENSLYLEKKEYTLKINNLEYKLNIFYNKNEITFQIDNNNYKILLFNYKKIYHLKELITILNLSFEKYNEARKIVELIDEAYNNSKLKLKFDNTNDNYLLIIKNNDLQKNQEKDFIIKINKNNYNINEKFDIIIKELGNMRQKNSALFEIEKEILSLKNTINHKLKENILLIESLQEKIKNNKEQLENNDYQIKLLKKEIFTLKHIGKNIEKNEAKDIIYDGNKDNIEIEVKDKIKEDNINEDNKNNNNIINNYINEEMKEIKKDINIKEEKIKNDKEISVFKLFDLILFSYI